MADITLTSFKECASILYRSLKLLLQALLHFTTYYSVLYVLNGPSIASKLVKIREFKRFCKVSPEQEQEQREQEQQLTYSYTAMLAVKM